MPSFSTSSASAAHPDKFNTTFTLRLRLRDDATGANGVVTFKATLKGTLTADHSTLTLTIVGARSQRLVLGNHTYTVTVPAVLLPQAPSGTTARVNALVQVGPHWR
jgi:hypothetical protein